MIIKESVKMKKQSLFDDQAEAKFGDIHVNAEYAQRFEVSYSDTLWRCSGVPPGGHHLGGVLLNTLRAA